LPATLTPSAITARIAQRVEQDLGEQKYAMWFDRTARFDVQDDGRAVRVSVPTRFAADWIGKHYRAQLVDAIHAEAGEDTALDLCVRPEQFDPSAPPLQTQPQRATPPAPLAAPPRATTAPTRRPQPSNAPGTVSRHRLDRFITGPSNKLAHAAAQRLADLDDPSANHPLFLHGICGVGKTHLLQGICQQVRELRPDAKALYLTGEQFTNQYITAVRQGKLDAFRRRIRKLDVLAIDDVHFIASKEKTQQEFLHCFEENDLAGARVVLASDSHPRAIDQFSDALVSRCIRGLVIELTEPDPVTRKQIIAELAQRRGLFLQPAVIAQLADRFDGSVRDIEGALTKLHALATLTDQPQRQTPGRLIPVGRALLDQLPELAQPKVRRPVKFGCIAQAVCERLLLEQDQLVSSSRSKHVVLARSLVVYLARELTPMSYPEIAHAMGRKTHSTVITACQRMTKLLTEDAPLLLPGGSGQTTPGTLLASLKRELVRAA